MTEQQSLETRRPDFLDVIREVVANPEVPVDKLKAIMDMQFLLEDRQAEKEFDAALIAAQADVQTLKWDKVNKEKNSKHVSYPKIDRMLRPIRLKHHFTQSWDTEPGTTPDMVMLCCDLIHVGGHKRRYRTPMPIDGAGPKGGGVMTKSQAVNSGTSYGMRNLAKMIWNIPMLVDKEDTDGNEQYEKINEKQLADLRALADEAKKEGETSADVLKAFCDYMKIDAIENLPASMHKSAVTAMQKRKNANTK